ncbi:MAG TPA: nitroreductase family deazaflavin-dependent oxidoreductase [Cryobacterium sp.]|nr:nitroreductase family deazaflavin-dependent oxidoreductase [Cryobacterium sp.]
MGLRNDLTDLQMKTMSLLHRAVLRLSGGRMLRSIGSMPALELHTLGRSTGKRRTTMLTAPVHGDGRYVLVASKGGDDRNPQWYLNLVANPDVELTVDGTTLRMRARTATVAEKAELWPAIIAAYRGYDGYQQKTGRDIPVVICEPRP